MNWIKNLFYGPRRALKNLLKEREQLFWKNRFDLHYLIETERELITGDIIKWQKSFDMIEEKLRGVQGKYDDAIKAVESWNVSRATKDEKIKELLDKKHAEMQPLTELIQPVNIKIQKATQLRALFEKCKTTEDEMIKYIILLKRRLKDGKINLPTITADGSLPNE